MRRSYVFGAAALFVLFITGLGTPGVAAPVPEDTAKAGKPIDVVICLDVSGSMNGLIDSARAKLWDIVNDLAKIKPTPQLRVGLYSYGHSSYDSNAGWVRKETDLTTDLDTIYQKLFGLTIGGGSELVARVCREALEQQKWAEEKEALRIILVAGNESAAQDKSVSLNEIAEKAKNKGVLINTIYCGNLQHTDAPGWRDFATLANGKFINIDQNRGTVVVATPMDKELAELGAKLTNTYVRYGKEGEAKAANQLAQNANAAQAGLAGARGRGGAGGGAGVAAARTEAMAGALYRNADWDLVDRLKNDTNFDITKVPEAELSEELRKMTPEERVAHVKKMAVEREALQKQINELSVKRQAFIREEQKKNATAGDKALDEALREIFREQAGSKGMKISE
jgi:hypothetical protein